VIESTLNKNSSVKALKKVASAGGAAGFGSGRAELPPGEVTAQSELVLAMEVGKPKWRMR
jgi:hypothetical protein